MIIMRILTWLKDNDVSLPRLTVMLLNLYDNHIGANEKESDIKEIKQGLLARVSHPRSIRLRLQRQVHLAPTSVPSFVIGHLALL